MTETAKKSAPKQFEQTAETMPSLTPARAPAPAPAPGPQAGTPEPDQADVRSIRVPKLDQFTVWQIIEMLKSL